MSLPMKSLMLTYFKDGNEIWDYEMVNRMMREFGKTSEYWKFQYRFWLMEFLGCGLIVDVDYAEDDGSKFKTGNILSKYKITPLGLQRIESMLE